MPHVLDPVWITLEDGCRLAARVWLPDHSDRRPCPAILEAIPYRRTDGTLTIDHPRYEYWARHGFAGVRVDIRGSGDSDGVLEDEYLAGEQDDACEVIGWLAQQPWCNGRVGMIGYSWGGFAGLQVAARRPPQLAAVVTVNSTVRRYTDDCHYIGGVVNAHDMLSWATTMLAFDARPPDPEVVGDRWREMWDQRLSVAPPMIERWLSHQLEDEYWRHGSVSTDYEAIDCPVLAVGGWADPYRNAVLELLTHLRSPAFGLIGPWAHGYPHTTTPGPMIAFLSECERFFGRYLRNDHNGYDATPQLRAYLQDFDSPAASQMARGGRWVSIPAWPPPNQRLQTLQLTKQGLSDERPPEHGTELRVGSVQTNGLMAGSWCPYGGPSLPPDQRPDDAVSLCLDSEPLQSDVESLGFPRLRLRIGAGRSRARLIARLCDVSPSGESLLVTRGVCTLEHGDEQAEVQLRLDCAGHRFAAGHRIRLAISPTYWPWVWPAAEPVTLGISSAAGALELPLLGQHGRPDLGSPEPDTDPVSVTWVTRSAQRQLIRRDLATATVQLLSEPDFLGGRLRLDDLDLEVEDWGENLYRITDDEPLSAEVRCRRQAALSRPGWDVRIEADATMRSTAAEFLVDTELTAFLDGDLVVTRRFETRVLRCD